jgi:CO/xanthine dehydrogenase FAD-binding subunit
MLRNLTASASTLSRPQRLVTRSVPATTEAAGQAAWSIRSTASDAGSAYAAVSTSDFVPAASWSTAEAYVASVGWRREVEGNRLVHMCSVLLKVGTFTSVKHRIHSDVAMHLPRASRQRREMTRPLRSISRTPRLCVWAPCWP